MPAPKSNFAPNLSDLARAREQFSMNSELQANLQGLIDFYSEARLGVNAEPLPAKAPDWRSTASVDRYRNANFPSDAVQRELNKIKPISHFDDLVSVDSLRKRLTQAKFEQELNRLSVALASPAHNIPDRLYSYGLPNTLPSSFAKAPVTAIPQAATKTSQLASKVLGALGPLGTLVDLLTHSTDLNANEDAELQRRRNESAK